MEQIQKFYSQFESFIWSEKYWLTYNRTWADFENKYDVNGEIAAGSIRHPQPSELYFVLPIACFLLMLRYALERGVMKNIAKLMGVREMKSRAAEKIPKLDLFFKKSRRPNHSEVRQLANDVNMEERQVQRWFRIRRNQRKSSAMTKFCEGGWRFTFHLTSFCYGLYVLHDEDFFTNTDLIIDMPTWPHHHVKPEFYNYYMLALGFWTSVIMSLLSDVRRHDFYIMAIHHTLTCALMALSWSINYVRVGMLVLLAHDFADFFLEICKMMKYAKKEALSNLFFILFFLSWSVSRLYFYPRYIVYVCWYKYIEYYYEAGRQNAFAILTMISFLALLLVLHVIWTCIIARLVYELLFQKEWVDHRSDSEAEESSEGTCQSNGIKHEQNGTHGNGLMKETAKKDN